MPRSAICCGRSAKSRASRSKDLIANWNDALLGAEKDEEDLERPISRVLTECANTLPDSRLTQDPFVYEGAKGNIYVTQAADLLTFLQQLKLRDLSLPKNSQGLSRRLKSCTFRSFKLLPTDTTGVPALKRTGARKPIGFFRPDG